MAHRRSFWNAAENSHAGQPISTDLSEVELPEELFNRLGDNWRTMFRIAALAGGTWPERVKNAACGAPDEDTNDLVALLAAIWQVFKERGVVRMHSQELVDALVEVDEGRWKQADRGRPITQYYLRKQLKGVIPHSKEADDARRWREGGANARWGYTEMHFEGAWSRYLLKGTPSGKSYSQEVPPEEGHQDGNSSDTCGTAPENGAKTERYDVPDDGSDGMACRTASDTSCGQGTTSDRDVSVGVRHWNASSTPADTAESEQFHSVNGEVSDVSDECTETAPPRAEGVSREASGLAAGTSRTEPVTCHDGSRTFADTEREPGLPQLNLDGIDYFVRNDGAEANALIVNEIVADAVGGLIAIDLETAPRPAEAARLRQLRDATAKCKGTLAGLLKAKADPARIAEQKDLLRKAQAALNYAGKAGLDPHRADIRLLQLYGGGRRVAVIDLVPHGTGNPAAPQRSSRRRPQCRLRSGLPGHARRRACRGPLHAAGLPADPRPQVHQPGFGSRQLSRRRTRQGPANKRLVRRAPDREQVRYAAQDAVVCWRVAQRALPALGEQASAYEIQMTRRAGGGAHGTARPRLRHRGACRD